MTADHFSATFYRDQRRALIHCSNAGCRFAVDDAGGTLPARLHLELLMQSTDNRGWPVGPSRTIYEADISMLADAVNGHAYGHHRLPFRLSEDVLRKCYVRLNQLDSACVDKTNSNTRCDCQ